ncbi:DUF1963 domain-containing protein [Kitasatospora sp. NBC_01266]|uniref:DUF1963 domain-containing protein n=1 Tax=Kitasatospora sp. NBC_01266 TaxID=2903572 RepID=UPI002E355BB9|nr:DUF1963 domain-containing protein [Kitasatospora sp. NBC_01266]
MTRHTPPRPVDVEQLFPELVPLRRTTTRLHPRTGTPGVHESSVGGPLNWPAAEPWPHCVQRHYGPGDEQAPPGGSALVPVVQLYRQDAPEVPFPDRTDLLQVLWCPFEHEECEPRPQVFWRSAADVAAVIDPPPVPAGARPHYVPRPCTVHPEPFTEYPNNDLPLDLVHALEDRFDRLEARTGLSYWGELSTAEGIKLGGYPGWTQEPDWPDCPTCGDPMAHLLTVASWEYSGGAWRAWLPLEDRTLVDGQETCGEVGRAAMDAAGLMLGDAGGVYVFECRACPDRPVDHRFDCP